ncbi:Soluble guanylate cyclase 88E [Schistosoma japonicum]|uniref:guanylate cyclase n=1 Tax=Schistosoma japonicum TaxID=6182 RepID=A0A4Z2D5J3_SCHJA|nr:Soluble guanylate cyclase 88E [Schistosoma japonicum]
MYGVLFEILRNYIVVTFGSSVWEAAVEIVNGHPLEIHVRQNYSTRLFTGIIKSLCDFIGLPEEDIYYEFGIKSVDYLTNNGFRNSFRVLGKNYIDFLQNVNELHEYLRFSYPKLKPPDIKSLQLITMSSLWITLPYLIYIAKLYFDLDVSVKLTDKRKRAASHIYTFKLYNKGLSWIELLEKDNQLNKNISLLDLSINLPEKQFLGMLPFHLILTKDMTVKRVGTGFLCLRNDLQGRKFTTCFQISKPKTDPTFDGIYASRFTTFELVLLNETTSKRKPAMNVSGVGEKCRFKGEMIHVEEWQMMLFMGTPIIRDTKQLYEKKLRISDLNMFDSSRDIIFQGEQQSDEVMKLYENIRHKAKQMEKSMLQLEKIRKVTDDLLYQCIPRTVARKIRNGTPAIETIQTFDEVTICFTKVVDFAAKCMHIGVEQVIELLNKMYSLYDALTENHKVYKVETINDSYMLVSGAPHKTALHAAHIIDTALEIIEATQLGLCWPEPNTNKQDNNKNKTMYTNENLHLYIGCHTGPIVAGVVGYKTPRYCLFGDTVNTSSRMMSHGLPDKVHISESCAQSLSPYPYELECRGETPIKGKGNMKTYFVIGRKSEFTLLDQTDGTSRSFADILYEDLRREDETPSENSDDSAKFSINLSDRSGTTEEDSPLESPKNDVEQLETDAKPPEKHERKSSAIGSRRSSKSGDKRRKSKLHSNPTSPLNKDINVNKEEKNSGFVNNQNTTEILNEAARRLVETKMIDVKNEQKKKQDITFNLDHPKEILKEPSSESELQEIDNNIDEAAQFKSKSKPPERSRLIKLNPANKVSRRSMQVISDKVDGNNLNSNEDDDDDRISGEDKSSENADQHSREMVKQGQFDAVPALPFCSPQAAIFRDLGKSTQTHLSPVYLTLRFLHNHLQLRLLFHDQLAQISQ